VEVRLYAEDAEAGFLPATGPILAVHWPEGDGIRVDAGIAPGDEITGRFDPMLAKIAAWGTNRREALERLRQALDETVVLGLTTNLAFLRWLVRQRAVGRGNARIDTLASIWKPGTGPSDAGIPAEAWSIAARVLGRGGWRLNAAPVVRLVAHGAIGGHDEERTVVIDDSATSPDVPKPFAFVRAGGTIHLDVRGRSIAFEVAPPPDVDTAARAAVAHQAGSTGSDVVAPMPGLVIAVHGAVGDEVRAGDPVVTLEAMKMEHVVAAIGDGRLASLDVHPGDQVTRGRVLATIA
ncbi:MAG TPA: biotin/lipoyl-containing protein, partial [Candidatus Limnocylindrales bacterium]|nr:biotin/lipoyl-containing protein [Candidatus Limnocylindrales bacterium]